MSSIEEIFDEAKQTYIDRSSMYSDTWEAVGVITHALYPGGILLDTPEKFAKFHILQWMIGKMVRYAYSDEKDCIHDAGIYAFILEHIDGEARNNLSKP